MKLDDQEFLEKLLEDTASITDIEKIIFFFDRREYTSRKSQFLRSVIWLIWLIFGLICMISLIIFLSISKSDAITTLSILLAILFPVYIERIQRPSLRIYAATFEKTPHGGNPFWAVKILVDHPVLNNGWQALFANSWLERRTAISCRARLKVFSGRKSLNLIQDMPARWSGAIQPSQPEAIVVTNGYIQSTIHRFVDTVDIAPGEDNGIDIVIQYEREEECYGWNNETYLLVNPRMSRLKLVPGEYIIEISIFYGDKTLKETFTLVNCGNAKELKFLEKKIDVK